VQFLIDYVENEVGKIVLWLHGRNAYFGILVDSLYSSGGFDRGDDDDYSGYRTYGHDDGYVGGFTGPKSGTPQTRQGKYLDNDDDDESGRRRLVGEGSATASEPAARSPGPKKVAVQLTGLTALAGSIVAMPTLKPGEAYAHGSAAVYATKSRANIVMKHGDLVDAYYDAISGQECDSPVHSFCRAKTNVWT
jgi:hypothetical protein